MLLILSEINSILILSKINTLKLTRKCDSFIYQKSAVCNCVTEKM